MQNRICSYMLLIALQYDENHSPLSFLFFSMYYDMYNIIFFTKCETTPSSFDPTVHVCKVRLGLVTFEFSNIRENAMVYMTL